jgi:hypothetical protein
VLQGRWKQGCSFFEKKEPKKLFSLCALGRLLTGQSTETSPKWKKVFCFFFSKKKTLAFPRPPGCHELGCMSASPLCCRGVSHA